MFFDSYFASVAQLIVQLFRKKQVIRLIRIVGSNILPGWLSGESNGFVSRLRKDARVRVPYQAQYYKIA
jgi:hypothetical protein